jgi:hypothetical protein
MGDGDALLKVTVDAAKAGDMTAMSLLMPRMMPTLKPEGTPVRFALDPTLSSSKQIESVLAAVAAGQLTVEEGLHVAKVLEALSSARAIENEDGNGNLIEAFRQLSRSVSQRDGMPIPEAEADPDAPLSLECPQA